MANRRFTLIAGIAMLLSIAPLLLFRQSPEAKAANRIRNQYLAVEAPMLRLPHDASWEEVDHFLGKLKEIDTDDAPQEVQRAMTLMVSAVEVNSQVRQSGGDTNAANERVAAAQKDLIRALEKWRGQPF